jgi:hypothetical protein
VLRARPLGGRWPDRRRALTPTSFSFTLTLPGDRRFIGAIRALAAQAASYAQLSVAAGEALASEVERATASAIQSSRSAEAPIDVAFSGDEAALTVVIGCETRGAAERPDSASSEGMSVHWQADGSRLTCQIRQATQA